MTPVDWQHAWRAGRTPWDAGASPPALHHLLERDLVPGGRVLVPGCGTGYDLAALARHDREIIGIDISEDARRAFVQTHQSLPGSVSYEVADFFSYEAGEDFDFVWDYTFFCALDPSQRADWAAAVERFVKPTRMLATLLFPYEDPISDRQGPPWPVNASMVRELIGESFDELEVTRPERSHPGREGREYLALWRRRG